MSRGELEEELSYLRRSIEDLDSERSAGDVSDADYRRIGEHYRRRASEVERELAADPRPDPEGAAPPSFLRTAPRSADSDRAGRLLASRRMRLATGWGAFGCLAVAAVLLVMAVAHFGPFASPAPLSANARVQIMLAEADVLGAKGDVTQALATYDRVLVLEPTQPVALANGGWLARVAGLAHHEPLLVRNADAEIEAAVEADPGYALARAYDGVLLLDDRHQPRRAVAQFRAMLRDHPSATLLRSIRSAAVRAFSQAGSRVPTDLAAAPPPAAGAGAGTGTT
jgi:tetratricopeptide (TPR) repeat protein